MDNFWENLRRYPSFFISSFTGLILVILTPFKKLFKILYIFVHNTTFNSFIFYP
jgi:hypothetical protein